MRSLVSTLTAHLHDLAPLHLAEPWDNVGLLAGDPVTPVKSVLIALDLTPAVYAEVLRRKANFLLVYHPPLFKPIKSLVPSDNEPQSLALKLAAKGIAIYCLHTTIDVALNGTNDALAAALNLTVTSSLRFTPGKGSYLKLVTFIPQPHVEQVADALFAAGCGHIGVNSKYTRCLFRTSGTGTFQGDDASNPTVGTPNHYEHQPEIRFETILPTHRASEVIAALKDAHPYEEPAFDLLQMLTPPEGVGLGRIASLSSPQSALALARSIKKRLGLPALALIPPQREKAIETVALLAGSAGRLPLEQKPRTFDALITGELKHHDQIAYAAAGIPVFLLGHAASERPILALLKNNLSAAFPALPIDISPHDPTPFVTV